MKLKTKIIPLTFLVTSSAFVAPFSLSSCNGNGVIGRSFDLTRVYLPKMDRYDKKTMPRYEINQEYARRLGLNPETFIQDYMWSKSWDGSSFDQLFWWLQLFPKPRSNFDGDVPTDRNVWGSSTYNYKSDVECISNLSIDFASWNYIDQHTWDIPLMSFTLKFNSSVSDIYFAIEDEDCSVSLTGSVSGEIKFLNVPFWIATHYVYDEITGIKRYAISFEPNSEWMFGHYAQPCPEYRLEFDIASSLSGEITYDVGYVTRVADDWHFIREMKNGSTRWTFDSLDYQTCFNNVFTSSFYLERVSCSDI